MIPDRPRLRAVVAVPFLLVCGLAACGRVPGQFEVLQNQAPKPGCAIDTDEMIYRGEGHLDVSLVGAGASSAYWIFPLVVNNLPGSTSGGPDGNEIDVHSFAVDIGPSPHGSMPANVQALFDKINSDPSLPDYALLHYSLPWAVTIKSGGGKAATAVNGFPVALAQQVLATGDVGVSATSMLVNVRVRVFGSTNTQDIESDPFDYPIYVCNGCLVANVLPCPYTLPPANPGNECNIAQDSYVDCCSFNGELICPPIVVAGQ